MARGWIDNVSGDFSRRAVAAGVADPNPLAASQTELSVSETLTPAGTITEAVTRQDPAGRPGIGTVADSIERLSKYHQVSDLLSHFNWCTSDVGESAEWELPGGFGGCRQREAGT